MARKAKAICSACGRDIWMTPAEYEALRQRDRGRGLRTLRCETCAQVAWRFDDLAHLNEMPEWKRMSLLPVGAQVKGRRRPYSGLDEFRTFRSDDPDALPPDDIGNRVDGPFSTAATAEREDGPSRRGRHGGAEGSPRPVLEGLPRDVENEEEGNAGEVAGAAGTPAGGLESLSPATAGSSPPPGTDGPPRGRSGRSRRLFKATCSRCSRPAVVPFRPTPARTIYCRDCMREKGMRSY